MKFCDKLLTLRKNNNMSQEQLADKLGVSRQAVSKWESGASIPDMEKMMQLCKILNCSLDELVDDGAGGNTRKVDTHINFSQYYQEILDFIIKTLNMFWSMRLVEKVKCLLEMFFIMLILFILWEIAGTLIKSTFGTLLYWLPLGLEKVIFSVCSFVYRVFGIIVGVVLFIHIFKIRYLDYFITIEDSQVNIKSIEEPIAENEKQSQNHERKFLEKKKNTIIIRDPKHTTYGFFEGLAKIVVFFIKCLAFFIAIPCVFCFIGLIFICTFSIWNLKVGIFFLGLTIALIGAILINYLVIKIIYQFILELKYNFKKLFIILIIGFIAIGVGSGITFCDYLTFGSSTIQEELITTTEEIEMKNNILLNFSKNSCIENIEWIADENQKNILVEIKHYEFNTPYINYYLIHDCDDETNDCSSENSSQQEYSYLNYQIHFLDEENFFDYLNSLMDKIKNRQRLEANYEKNYSIKIYTSTENINILKDNYQKVYLD